MSLILSGTDGLSDVDGSAATPAIRGTDANTGIFFPAADTIAFAEGGAEVARFDSSGRLGLANTNPSKLLTIGTSTTANPTVRLNGSLTGGSDTYQYSFGLDDTADFAGIKLNYADRVSKGLQIFTAPGFSFPITFYTNSATQAMTLDTSGNLGIGTTSPAAKLQTQQTSAGSRVTGALLQNVGSSASTAVSLDFAPHESSASPTTLARIDAIRTQTSNALTDLVFSTFNATLQERARIDSSGNLLVGTTTNGISNGGIQLQPAGGGASIPFFGVGGNSSSDGNISNAIYSTSLAQYQFYVGYGGTVFARSVVISSLSDARLKENIVDLDVGLDKIMALKPRKFDWKEGKGNNKKNVRGFIAQELEQVFPDLIDEWRDPAPEGEDPYKSVRQDLMPVLVKAIQEQQALITTLTARISALESA